MTVSISGTDGLTFNDATTQNTSAFYGGLAFRNRIINGAMVIDQRNAGASVSFSTGANVYPIDRFQGSIAQGSGHTAQQSTTVPAGFVNSVLVTIGTGASASAGNVSRLFQVVEGFNCADLDWGLATASTVTLSFWVKSSLTGTFAGGIYNSAANRNYVFTYAISAANTWEQKSITIAGDTSGTWLKNNGAGIYVNWDLGTGSTYQGTAGAWAAGVAWATSGSVKLAATSGANWSVTGVQLEKGSTATSFDYRPYGTELGLCQRYYLKLQNDGVGGDAGLGCGIQQSTGSGAVIINFPVTMRAEPTAVFTSLVATDFTGFANAATVASVNCGYNTAAIGFSYATAGAIYRPVFLSIASSTSGNLAFSSEL